MRRMLILLLLPVVVSAGQLPRTSPLSPPFSLPVDGGDKILTETIVPARHDYARNLDDEQFEVGTTFYDYQHNGTAGKMIGVDEGGYVHFVWMNGEDVNSIDRHIFYNLWDPATQSVAFADGGEQVNTASLRAGYTCLALKPDGFCFPTFHNKTAGSQIFGHSSVSIDFFARTGAYTTTEPARLQDGADELELDWPKSAIDTDGRIHMVATENPLSGELGAPQRIYYARGVPLYDVDQGFGYDIDWEPVGGETDYLLLDTVMVIAADIACSRDENSERVVICWSHSRDTLTADPSQDNNDLYMLVSEDGGDNWGAPVNVTNFEFPDRDCFSGDTLECDKDTFRVYTDMSIILDEANDAHIAFTTGYWYELEGLINIVYSDIWHWGEANGYFSNMAHGYFEITAESPWVDPGGWQRYIQRPNLAIDPQTGFLYASYMRYDTAQTSALLWPQADAWVTASTDNGIWWSEAVNISNTDGGQGAAPGESLSERDITVAELVSYDNGEGYLHMEYILDLEAGGWAQNEGAAVECPVIYSRISLDEIPLTPLHDAQYPALRVDSTGFPPDPQMSAVPERPETPRRFTLYQNYPNPFNPATKIQFDLNTSMEVSLKVFDITGREVVRLLEKAMTPAGSQTIEFDGNGLASGIYIYRLETAAGASDSKKMILLK